MGQNEKKNVYLISEGGKKWKKVLDAGLKSKVFSTVIVLWLIFRNQQI